MLNPVIGGAARYFESSNHRDSSNNNAERPANHGVSFDSGGLSPHLRFEAFRDFWSGLYDVSGTGSTVQHMRSTAKLWRLGGVSFGHFVFPPNKSKKTTSLSRNFSDDVLVLRVPTHGSMRLLIDGHMIEVNPETAYLCDEMSASAYLLAPQFTALMLVIPFDAIGYDPYVHPRIIPIGLRTPAGRMLLVLLDALLMEVQEPIADLDELAKPVIDFIRAVALGKDGNDRKNSGSIDSRAAAMRRFVEEHIGPDHLDVDVIGRATGASRASVYRVFQPEGGVNRAILRRRLNAALVDVATSTSARNGIADAARLWGIGDASRFSRACRREFGYNPSAVFSFMNVPPEHLATGERQTRGKETGGDTPQR